LSAETHRHAFAAYAAVAGPAFLSDAIVTVVAPNSKAFDIPTVAGLSLYVPVGFLVSSLA